MSRQSPGVRPETEIVSGAQALEQEEGEGGWTGQTEERPCVRKARKRLAGHGQKGLGLVIVVVVAAPTVHFRARAVEKRVELVVVVLVVPQ